MATDVHRDGSNAHLAATAADRQKKSFATTTPSHVDKHHSNSDKHSEMSHPSGNNTRALAGLMMVKRRMGNWKKNTKAGSALGGSSVKSGLRMAMENSYQLSPRHEEKFDVGKVQKVVEDSLHLFLVKQSAYNPSKSTQISRYISEDVKSRVKQLGFKRYKIVVNVMIGQTHEQGMEFASRCMWDAENDNVATVTRQHKDMYVVVNVFGIYFE